MKIDCAYCYKFLFFTTPDWEKCYFKNNRLSYVPVCSDCLKAEMKGATLVRGIGPMESTQVNTNENTTRAKKVSKEELFDLLNFETISNMINDGLKVQKYAAEMNANGNDLRDILIEHFGERIEFRRGRNGGVYWRA